MSIFQSWPKAELHVHLDGSLRPETVWEISRDANIRLPFDSFEELERHLRMPRRCSLTDYLKAFEHTLAVMQEREFLTRTAYEFVEDVAADGVHYVEVRFAPSLHRDNGLKMDQIIEAILDGLHQASEKTGTKANLICCAMRQEDPSLSEMVAEVASEYQGAGVVALDLAGPEDGYPAEPHRAAFEYALDHDLNLTIHAGEPCCGDNVARAIHLGAHRIGHGTFTKFDPASESLVAERNIPLEVCPTSNLQISGFIEDYADHPIHHYLDKNLNITLNTDNRLMSNVTLSDEYDHMAPSIPQEKLRQIARNGFAAAFLPKAEKQSLLDKYFSVPE
jgi:adenosine deaminase